MEALTLGSGFAALVLGCAVAACGSTGAAPKQTEAVAGAPATPDDSDAPTCLPDDPASGDGAFVGDVTLATEDDVAAIADVAEIHGSLRVTETFSGVLSLPNLTYLGGELHVEGSDGPPSLPNQVTSVRLPNLERIDGQLWLYLAWNLRELDLRSLESVGGQIFIMRNISLQVARFDSLTEVEGGVTFSAQLSLPGCITEPFPLIGGESLANGSADQDCHCESPCGYLQARCD